MILKYIMQAHAQGMGCDALENEPNHPLDGEREECIDFWSSDLTGVGIDTGSLGDADNDIRGLLGSPSIANDSFGDSESGTAATCS